MYVHQARDCPRKRTAELNTGKAASEGQNQEGTGGGMGGCPAG